jgi:hypothetical protein
MADDKGFFDKFKAAFDEPPKSAQPDRRPLDQQKAGDMAAFFRGEKKQAGDVMQRRMDKIKGGY